MSNLVDRATDFALAKHAFQRYGDVPYSIHLTDVVATLQAANFDHDVLQAAGWLHDVIEDTGVQYPELRKEFGHEVAEIVYAVTNEKGRSRREILERTIPLIAAAGRNAVAVKLADRASNMRRCVLWNSYKGCIYLAEHVRFMELMHPGCSEAHASLVNEIMDLARKLQEQKEAQEQTR